MQPRIAIPFPYFDQAWASRTLPEYVNAIRLAGGEPLVIAHSATPALAAQLVKTCAAIVLPGSPADLDPQKYGEARDPRTAAADPARDMLDELLLQDAHAMRKPILGVCYGVQSLNVWRSGTLVQHIESEVLHQRPEGAPAGTVISHDVVVPRKSRLGEILASHVAEISGELKSPRNQMRSCRGPRTQVYGQLVSPSVGGASGGRPSHRRAFAAGWHHRGRRERLRRSLRRRRAVAPRAQLPSGRLLASDLRRSGRGCAPMARAHGAGLPRLRDGCSRVIIRRGPRQAKA